MRLGYRIGLIAASAVVVDLVIGVGLRDPEPSFAGRRLSVWLEDYGDGDYVAATAQLGRAEANAAVREIGTNAIPFLMRRLRVTGNGAVSG